MSVQVKTGKNYRRIYLAHDFFIKCREVIMKVSDDSITFKVPPMHYMGQTRKLARLGSIFSLSAPLHVIPDMQYEIDEDNSNEDQLCLRAI